MDKTHSNKGLVYRIYKELSSQINNKNTQTTQFKSWQKKKKLKLSSKEEIRLANEHENMLNTITQLVIREMQVQTTMRYYNHTIPEWLKLKQLTIPSAA